MTTTPHQAPPTDERRRLTVIGLLRASATNTALVVAYYLLPLSRLADLPLAVFLAAGLP